MKGNSKVMISVFITWQGQVLLYCIGNKVISPSWAGLGNRFDQAALDQAKQAMLSKLEIMNSDLLSMELRYVTMRYVDGEMRQNYCFFAETNHELGFGPIGNMKWINFYDIPNMEISNPTRGILRHYLDVGRSNNRVYCGVVKEKGVAISELEEF